jgi:hypothetical protein
MLKKSFVFMMLLAASLIGIGSAAYHQPEVAIAQPQPQSPNTAAPPTLGKRLTSPQGMQQQQQSNVGTLIQIQQDKALVERIFPYIIQKIDGKTLAQKIDAATLLQKIDAKTLAAKVLPFLDIKVNVVSKEGQRNNNWMRATCGSGQTLVSGGFDAGSVYSFRLHPNNEWFVASSEGLERGALSYANCLHAELSLRQEPRPPPPPPPSQPPGGPPLQPPPNLGK